MLPGLETETYNMGEIGSGGSGASKGTNAVFSK